MNCSQISTFHLDDIEGRVIPLFKGFPGWGVIFGVIFIWSQNQGKIRSQRSSLLVQPLALLRIEDVCISYVTIPGDILMSSFVTVRILERLHFQIWSEANCHVYVIVRYLPMYLGINTILVVAVERFVAIVLPLHFRAFVTPGKVKLQLAFAWLLTLVELVFPAYVVQVRFDHLVYAVM